MNPSAHPPTDLCTDLSLNSSVYLIVHLSNYRKAIVLVAIGVLTVSGKASSSNRKKDRNINSGNEY